LRPLAGVRVLEFGHFIAAPRACQILADHGAEVIKVEPPGGENTRFVPPHHDGVSIYFASHNRGKKSIVLDLKQDRSREVLRRLIASADVLVSNYTPTTAEKLGLDHASASAINPRIIVLQISAFGSTGAARELGGVDGTMQARSGIADLTGQVDGPPTVTQVQMIDHLTAVEGALGVLMALRLREETGTGTLIDLAMMDVAMGILAHQIGDVALNRAPARRNGSAPPYALANAYEAADGYVFLAPMSILMWKGVCDIIGRPDLAAPDSPYLDSANRLRDRAVLEGTINEWTRTRSRKDVIAAMSAAGVSCSPINAVAEAIADPLVLGRGMIQRVEAGDSGRTVPVPGIELKIGDWSADPPRVRVHELGEDSRAILADLGLADGEVTSLLDQKVVIARA
jgi:crotonobetainyl-CoA:carnitine CoA-transferase CaiB-like acyl-CoA transferase